MKPRFLVDQKAQFHSFLAGELSQQPSVSGGSRGVEIEEMHLCDG